MKAMTTSKSKWALGWVFLATGALGGCTWSSESGDVLPRRVADWESTRVAIAAWGGEPIVVQNESGYIRIVGDENVDRIRLDARFYAGAANEEDAEAAYRDVEQSLAIELREGKWLVSCASARESHGSAVPSTTGCDLLTVHVPQGSELSPHDIQAHADFGGIMVSGVVGGVKLRAPFGLHAEVQPTRGSSIDLYGEDLVSGDCPSVVYLPEDFAADSVNLTVARRGTIDTAAFADLPLPKYSSSTEPQAVADLHRGAQGTGAKRIAVRSSLGDAVLTTGPILAEGSWRTCRH